MHEREVFPTLENIENEKGEVLHRINQGDRIVADDLTTKKNGHLAFAFRDKDDRAVLPKLNNEGAIPVAFDAGTTLRGRGRITAGNVATFDSGTDEINNHALVAEIALTADREYTKLSAFGSCFRDSEFIVVLVNDEGGSSESSTVLGEFIVGPGNFNQRFDLVIDTFNTTGFTGTCKLQLKASNIKRASKLSGAISVNEIVANTTPNP